MRTPEITVKLVTSPAERVAEDQQRTLSFYAETFSDLYKLRVTSLQSAEECTRRWFADTIGANISPQQNVHSKIGTLIHLLCENKLKLEFWKQQLLDAPALSATIKELYTIAPIKELTNFTLYCDRLEAMLPDWELLEIESEYKMPIYSVDLPIYGQVDAVFRHKTTGRFRILDHKTNRRPELPEVWQKKLQPQLYSAAVMMNYGINEIEFMIGQVNNREDIYFSYTSADIATIEDRCGKIWQNILRTKDKRGEGKVNKYCAYCAHKYDCPAQSNQLTLLTMLGSTR